MKLIHRNGAGIQFKLTFPKRYGLGYNIAMGIERPALTLQWRPTHRSNTQHQQLTSNELRKIFKAEQLYQHWKPFHREPSESHVEDSHRLQSKHRYTWKCIFVPKMLIEQLLRMWIYYIIYITALCMYKQLYGERWNESKVMTAWPKLTLGPSITKFQ